MFKVIETTYSCIRLPIKPGIRLKPGNIGRIIEFNNNLVIDLANSKNYSGVIGNRRYNNTNNISWDKKHLVKLWNQRFLFRTNLYDKHSIFDSLSSKLYVNDDGLLTSFKPSDDSLIVAQTTKTPEHSGDWLEALWL